MTTRRHVLDAYDRAIDALQHYLDGLDNELDKQQLALLVGEEPRLREARDHFARASEPEASP